MLDAAAELLTEQGFAGVSHRAVASRARVPLGATTYYFSSREDLLAQALDHLARRWLDRTDATLQGLPPQLELGEAARAVVALVTGTAPTSPDGPDGGTEAEDREPGGEDLLVLYERYLQAGRHPWLRAAVVAYDDELTRRIGVVLDRAGLPADPTAPRLLLAVTDGTLVSCLARGTPPPRAAELAADAVEALLRRHLASG